MREVAIDGQEREVGVGAVEHDLELTIEVDDAAIKVEVAIDPKVGHGAVGGATGIERLVVGKEVDVMASVGEVSIISPRAGDLGDGWRGT